MPELAFLFQILSFIGTIFWITMMIDCLRNNRQYKGRWMIFMLITNWVGAVVYFFVVRPTILNPVFTFLQNMLWSSRSSSVWQQQPSQTQTHRDPPASPLYRDYQQGYQPSEPLYQPPLSTYQSASQGAPEQSTSYPMYEQPQAQYPEMPPMQQQ